MSELVVDHLVIATGHQWPEEPEVRPGYFLSPWPASALAAIPSCHAGIRGSSLTAIDAAVALAGDRGAFVKDAQGGLAYVPSPNSDDFRMTMLSRKGLLPEADFYHPLPYASLAICTTEAVERLVANDVPDLLDRVFALFKQELSSADPDYAAHIGLADLALEDFCEAYFADRIAADPFVWAKANLREAEADFAAERTVPWRYAILRMHEVIALIVPHLDDTDYERFSRRLKPVFVDDYATVPHESIRRLLALHAAGKLDVVATGDDYRIDSHRAEGGALLLRNGEQTHFPAFVEATGQRPLAAKDFPFPSLRRQGIVRDMPAEADAGLRGIVIDDQFHPIADDIPMDRLFCLSLPFLLGRHPFIQGITSSHEMGLVVGKQLADAINRTANPRHEAAA